METKNINEVRQVLMNELGLTRELIRTEVEKIVKETMEKKINDMFSNGVFDRIIRNEIDNFIKNERSYPYESKIKDIIYQAARERVEEFLNKNIKIEKN